jgi:hypothetical protein
MYTRSALTSWVSTLMVDQSRRSSYSPINISRSASYMPICSRLSDKLGVDLIQLLSVRIEELNAQISTLYVENLRLRASEIALAAQLQREREKSWRIMTDAELAVRVYPPSPF